MNTVPHIDGPSFSYSKNIQYGYLLVAKDWSIMYRQVGQAAHPKWFLHCMPQKCVVLHPWYMCIINIFNLEIIQRDDRYTYQQVSIV